MIDKALFEDWEILNADVIKNFATAFDICFHKTESYLVELFKKDLSVEVIQDRVRKLNAFYRTRLSNPEMDYITKELINKADNLENRILAGEVNAVEEIANICDRNIFVFATKYCSYINPYQYPIYDSLIAGMLQRINNTKHFYKMNNLKLETMRVNKNYSGFKDVVDAFIKRFDLGSCSYREIDKFLWLVGKNL